MEEIRIEKVEKQDAAVIAALADLIWHEHFTSIIGTAQVEYMLREFQSESAIIQQIDDKYNYRRLYYDDAFCGYMSFKLEKDSIFLSKLYVEKNKRKKGVARTAINYLVRIGLENVKDTIYLTVNRGNTSSIAAYMALGFSIVEERKTDIGNGFVMDDYVMSRQV